MTVRGAVGNGTRERQTVDDEERERNDRTTVTCWGAPGKTQRVSTRMLVGNATWVGGEGTPTATRRHSSGRTEAFVPSRNKRETLFNGNLKENTQTHM